MFQKFLNNSKVQLKQIKNFFLAETEIKFDDIFVIPFWLLNTIGYDFRNLNDGRTKSEKINIALHYFNYWFGFFNFNLFFFFTELELWHGITTNLQKRLFGITLLLTYFICSYRMISFWKNKLKILAIINKLKASYPKSDPSVLRIYGMVKIFQAIFVVVNSVLSFVTLIPVLRWIITKERTYLVPFPDFFYYDLIYPFGLIWSIYIGMYAIVMVSSFMLMTSNLITAVSVEFYSLSDGINKIQYKIEDEIDAELPTLIEKHQKIFQLVQDLSNIFSKTFFVRFIVSASIIGLNLFQLRTAENAFDCSIFLIYTCFELGQVFLQSYFGQFLTNASEIIVTEVYSCGWENWQRIGLKKKLITVMQRSQKPAVLTIWKFGVISLEQFTMVIDSAYSLTSLVMNLKTKP